MFQKRTLFERLRNPEGTAARTLEEDTGAQLQSILRNLMRLLNARVGQAPAQMDFGIPSPSDIAQGYPESVNTLQKTIRQCIERYEPRLKEVRVLKIDSDDARLAVRFHVTAKLATVKDGRQISFDTLIDPSGHVNLDA